MAVFTEGICLPDRVFWWGYMILFSEGFLFFWF